MSSVQSIQSSSAAQVAVPKTEAPPKAEGGQAAPSKPQSGDTVEISSDAKAALQKSKETYAQEATETPTQSKQEAAQGDTQAKRLLARQAETQKLLGS